MKNFSFLLLYGRMFALKVKQTLKWKINTGKQGKVKSGPEHLNHMQNVHEIQRQNQKSFTMQKVQA